MMKLQKFWLGYRADPAGSEFNPTGLVEFHPFKREPCWLGEPFPLGSWMVVRVEDGEDLGQLIKFLDEEPDSVRGAVIRSAWEEDLNQKLKDRRCALEMMQEFERLIERDEVPIKVADVHYQFDRQKVVFYFTASHRLDFRDLHREISQRLGKRVVLKQIGVRDYTRAIGGFGPCGRLLCCSSFLREFQPISLRMARQQNLYMTPKKLTGVCGKLLCCLGFEGRACQPAPQKGEEDV
jgi:cell fate regulator YaaT (PSP1 superfamily)